jgi:fatty-acyl-CoA synthase
MTISTMSFQDLTIGAVIAHAERFHSDTEIVSVETDRSIQRSTWGEVARNARRLASALSDAGIREGDRCATLAWNNRRHLEIYFGVSGGAMVCHTMNPRLAPEQIAWIVADAQDRVLFFDRTFLPLITALRDHLKSVEMFILMGPRDSEVEEALPGVIFYDAFIEAGDPTFAFPAHDEKLASSLCYTSGTTGHPKGVMYTHRSTILHAMACNAADGMNISGRDSMMPVVPMFHVSAWGTPYVGAMTGARMVMPGPGLDGASLADLIEQERVTVSFGVPTIWMGLLAEMKKRGLTGSAMKRTIVGGAAMPPSMFTEFRDLFGIELIHAWGMTETSPLGTLNQLKAKHDGMSDAEKAELRLSQGRPPFGVDLRVVDGEGNPLPMDGKSEGELHIRGHWIVERYFGQEARATDADGWFDTGDVATLDPDGFMVIRDRSKDIIKSGGEWISSVELENIAIGHPEVANAAAIAAQHEKWGERPVIIAVKSGEVSEADLIELYTAKLPHWQVPDRVIFVEALPLGATGKVVKAKLRAEYGDCLLQGTSAPAE